MSQMKKIMISKEKLYEALAKRNLTSAEASRELGFSDWFLSNCAGRGYLTMPGVKGLEMLYGIIREEYEVCPEEEVTLTNDEVPKFFDGEADPVIDYEKLGNVIFEAVYQAVKTAWAE